MPKPRLSKTELKALVNVRDMLASGVIEYDRKAAGLPQMARDYFAMGLRRIFNMEVPAETTECGTVACIGGWMGAMMNMTPQEADDYVNENDSGKFGELFYPFGGENAAKAGGMDYSKITPVHAVKAIDSFLKTGKPNWKRAVGRA